jgi:UDP-N-acetylglucosamine 1-carboxyvinyltransferase
VRATAPASPVDVTTEPFPGFPTDLQAQFMALMTMANGARASPRRFSRTASCMCRSWPGSAPNIRSTGETAIVEGVEPKLKGAPVMATDLRASVSLVIAGLAAEGETTVNRVYHLDRGFERLEEKLDARCGAHIGPASISSMSPSDMA